MGGARNADSLVRHDLDPLLPVSETMARINAQIHFMVADCNIERLRQFSGAGAKVPLVLGRAPFLHQLNAAQRFDRAK